MVEEESFTSRDVKHIFREHTHEADHLANLGTEGKRKIIFEEVKNTGRRKAILGYWDGSKKRRLEEWVRNCDQSR